MDEQNIPSLTIDVSKLSGKTRKLKAKWTPDTQEDLETIITKPLPMPSFNSGYPEDQPTMGFFMWGGVDPDRVKKEYPDLMNQQEKDIILEYMSNATEEDAYKGLADSRMDGSILGSRDMRTPDGKWIFPEQWDTHYVDKYNICPPREFVEDAVKWKEEHD